MYTNLSYLNSAGWSQRKCSSLCSCRAQNLLSLWWWSLTDCSPSAGLHQETWGQTWSHRLVETLTQVSIITENGYVKLPWRCVQRVKYVVGEGLSVFTPLQRGVTLLFRQVQAEESSAVQFHTGSHIPPDFGRTLIRLKFWRFGALRPCVKTYHCYQCSLQGHHTIEAFMCTAK